MLKPKYLGVAIVILCGSSTRSETFLATVIKIEDGKMTFARATYHEGKTGDEKYSHAKPETFELSKDIAVTRGHFLPVGSPDATEGRITGKTTAVPDGLNEALIQAINSGKKSTRPCLLTIADQGEREGKITAVNFWVSGSPK